MSQLIRQAKIAISLSSTQLYALNDAHSLTLGKALLSLTIYMLISFRNTHKYLDIP